MFYCRIVYYIRYYIRFVRFLIISATATQLLGGLDDNQVLVIIGPVTPSENRTENIKSISLTLNCFNQL
jgi:hypothetical protein